MEKERCGHGTVYTAAHPDNNRASIPSHGDQYYAIVDRSALAERPAKSERTMHPFVGILMGSKSDWPTMQHACTTLDELGIPYEVFVMSAHRTPTRVAEYARSSEERGLEVLIAAAGGAAHLAGVVAAHTVLPVLGVPMESKFMNGLDSLLSTVQMPAGIPVGTLAVGKAGAINAALLAAAILGSKHPHFREAVRRYREARSRDVLDHPDPREA